MKINHIYDEAVGQVEQEAEGPAAATEAVPDGDGSSSARRQDLFSNIYFDFMAMKSKFIRQGKVR